MFTLPTVIIVSLLKSNPLIVNISTFDLITETHVTSILRRHGLRPLVMTTTLEQLVVLNPPGDLTKTLDEEATSELFDIAIADKRSFGKKLLSPDRIYLSSKDIEGSGHPPFDLKALASILKVKPKQVVSVAYTPRQFLGSDFHYHVGFDIAVTSNLGYDPNMLSTIVRSQRCQILDPKCKDYYIMPNR